MNENVKVIRLLNLYGHTGQGFAGDVYDPRGLCPTIVSNGGGNSQPMIIENDKKNKETEKHLRR